LSSTVAATSAPVVSVQNSFQNVLLAAGIVQPVDSTAGTAPVGSKLTTQNEVVHHSNPKFQHDTELWNRIQEAEAPFTPVLTKKQKQKLRQEVLGKPPYRTRSRRDASPNPQ